MASFLFTKCKNVFLLGNKYYENTFTKRENTLRNLVSIQTINNIKPIEGADRIEQATVLGWHVVVGKGQFHEGEAVAYFEIDSVFPEELKALTGVTDKYIKTRRFKGIYSQGFCMSLSELSKEPYFSKLKTQTTLSGKEVKTLQAGILTGGALNCFVGTDLTKVLGVTKHEADARNADGQWWKKRNNPTMPKKWYTKFRLGRWFWKKFLYKPMFGDFPTNIVPKTDETRVQVLQDVLTMYKGTRCQFTEKIDGSSITFYIEKKNIFSPDKLHVCSRNKEIFDKRDFMYVTAKALEDKLEPGLVYQGEILGPGIQGNKYGLQEYKIFVYQVWSPKTKTYLSPKALTEHLTNHGIAQVPVLGEFDLVDDIDTLVDMAMDMSRLPGRKKETQREGIVIRPLRNVDGMNDKRFVGGRLSFKAINPKFLLKYE